MTINTGMAQLSETLWTGTTATYMLAVVAYTGEWAFGRKQNLVAEPAGVATRRRPARSKVLAGAGGPDVDDALSFEPSVPEVDDSDLDTPASTGGTGGPRVRDRAALWGRSAVGLTVLGLLLHLSCVLIRGIAVDRVPWGNMYEFTLVVGLIATLAWLITLARAPQLRFLGLFVMIPVVITMFLAGALYTKASALVPALQSYWLAIHVSSVAVAEGILMTSAALTTMYLIRSRYERLALTMAGSGTAPEKLPRFYAAGSRLPSASTLDRAAYRTVVFAFPIYTAGIIFGAIWAEAAWGRYWGWDPKETWAFISWVVYAMYLHARATAGWKGTRAGFINLLGFAAMTFNFFVINIVVSGLHSYAGL